MDESRDPPQRRGAARETALRLTARRQFAGMRKAQATARQGRRDRNGRSKPAFDVATAWDGNPRPFGHCPKGRAETAQLARCAA
ncbi:hypothetical protein A7S34_22235 [Salmonella enterica]|nr:hypothetical protein [Salmonella enterica]OHF38162.1 hypothetical protein A7S42_20220 [Salmonella enterica subsp. diarizonae serovar 38:[k]:-]OHL01878.1 hypothetical protein A7S89_22560 [Salmonella enterica subsp. enterica serovar Inverness]OHM16705.1 hypothetical protein A7T20_22330 [Salmonella enterica subsp. enterica serovar Muenchen]OHF44061.1 hypothetical protein A7S68_21920 [Salmonella enterica subsp. diarizonae serovar 38:[k]:-]